MDLQVILVVIFAVQLCTSTGNRRKNVNYQPITFNPKLDPNVKEDIYLNTPQLISKYGYPAERHSIVTRDGYILEAHRIPRRGAIPVLLFHGLFESSTSWIIMGPDKGFAYLLYDLGYDVWMGNARGNTYSKRHKTLRVNSLPFWDYSFHEIGLYDVPATIDYILQQTRFSRLHYIGHSQGGSTILLTCSVLPQYNNKIIAIQDFCPAAFIGSGKSPLVNIATYIQNPLVNYFNSVGTTEILSSSNAFKRFAGTICKDGRITQSFCTNSLSLLSGFDKEQLNMTMLPALLGHYPAGGSVKQLVHFGQIITSGRFRQFDYGKAKNLQIYGRTTPPDYDLSKVTVKVAIHYGGNDYLVVPKDIDKLARALPNVIGKYFVPQFSHIDFVYGIDARELVFYKTIRLMNLIERGNL